MEDTEKKPKKQTKKKSAVSKKPKAPKPPPPNAETAQTASEPTPTPEHSAAPDQRPETTPELTEAEKEAKLDAEAARVRKMNEMSIPLNSKGLVKARNNAELIRMCGAMITSQMVPKRFNKPELLFGALMFVRSLGLPDVAIRNVTIIDGEPALFGDAPLALCQASGELYNFKEIWFDKEYNEICFRNKNLCAEVWGAHVYGQRGKDGELREESFTLDDARKLELYPPKKEDGSLDEESVWHLNWKIMLRRRARAVLLNSIFADKINGVGIAEYHYNQTFFDEDHDLPARDVTNRESLEEKLKRQKAEREAATVGEENK